jgi:spectinomycin phosphotransferase
MNIAIDQWLIRTLNSSYGIQISVVERLFAGADMHATTYKASAMDGSDYFIKLKPADQSEASTTILSLLQSNGIQQLILPIPAISGPALLRSGNHTLVCYPFVSGQNGFTQTLTDNQWLSLGKTLRQVHSLDVPAALQKQLRRETFSPKWREAVRSLFKALDYGVQGDDITLSLARFMLVNRVTIESLLSGAEQLSQQLQQQPWEPVLCHADIHGGNVLLAEDGSLYLVDWDEPMMAPKERDLMFIGGGVGNVWNKPDEVKLFYQGYGETTVDHALLAYYRHERIVEDIALYGQEILLESKGVQDKAEMVKQFIAMFEAGGAVEIALNT